MTWATESHAHASPSPPIDAMKNAILTVGCGRGFVIEGRCARYVITAAHCLPVAPEMMSAHLEDWTYLRVLGKLNDEPSICAECLFVDPISGIAVLACPDDPSLQVEECIYDGLINNMTPIPIGCLPETDSSWPPSNGTPVFFLSHSLETIRANVTRSREFASLHGDEQRIESKIIGSPIVTDGGKAVGVITSNSRITTLTQALPEWLVCELTERELNENSK